MLEKFEKFEINNPKVIYGGGVKEAAESTSGVE